MTETAGDAQKPGGGYDAGFFEPLAEIEDRHFWFRTRNAIIKNAAARAAADFRPGYRVLEVGCGNGYALQALAAACPTAILVGTDLYAPGLGHARRLGTGSLAQADALRLPFAGPFGLIGLFDVLEHLPDDEAVLGRLFELLAPDGSLLLTVPAHMSLWSYFDEASRHCRRYQPGELENKLRKQGFRVTFTSPLFALLFPALWAQRRLAGGGRARHRLAQERAEEDLKIVPGLNELAFQTMRLEAAWLAGGRRLPFGTSLLVQAKRPDSQDETVSGDD